MADIERAREFFKELESRGKKRDIATEALRRFKIEQKLAEISKFEDEVVAEA